MVVLSVVDENLTFYTSHRAFKKANKLFNWKLTFLC